MIHKLDPAKIYNTEIDEPETKALSPCLIPSLGFQKPVEDEDVEWFANRWAKHGYGNFIRLFISGNWEPKLKLYKPYKRHNRKYHLTEKNPKHFDTLWRRMGYFVERYIKPMITLLDQQLQNYWRPGFWKSHWMNGLKNVNGTHISCHSLTHWEDAHNRGKPGFAETEERLLDLYDYVLREAKRHFGRDFLIEIGNEIDARTNYHRLLRKMCNKTLKHGNLDRRVFTSMLRENEFFYARPNSNVQQYCIRVLHNVRDYNSYTLRKHIFGDPPGVHMVSQDGQLPFKTKGETKREVLKILKSDSVGYEGNLRPILELQDGEWVNVGYDADWTLRSLPYNLFKGYALAFEAYLDGE